MEEETMSRKVQSQLLVDLVDRQRADAIALVTGTKRAEVYRRAITGGGLQELEAQYARELAALDPVATQFGLSRLELAGKMADDGLSLADVQGRKRYPRAA
jgi:phage portal protein BeeE